MTTVGDPVNSRIGLQHVLTDLMICDMAHTRTQACDEALLLRPDNSKALYRKGTSFMALSQWAEAKAALTQALALEPQSKPVKSALTKCAAKQKQAKLSEKLMAQKMFARPSKAPAAKDGPATTSSSAGAEAATAAAAASLVIPDDPVVAAEQAAEMALLAQKVGDPRRIQVSAPAILSTVPSVDAWSPSALTWCGIELCARRRRV